MTQDLCRAEFEKWFNKCDLKSFYFSRNKNGQYKNTKLNEWYDCWQSAWNAKPATEHNPADTSQNEEWK